MKVLKQFEAFLEAGIISPIEIEFVRFLSQLSSKEPKSVYLAAAACVHAQKNGHVCLDIGKLSGDLFNDSKSNIKITESLKTKWIDALRESELVSNGDELKPLVLEESRLYLHRFWSYEEELSHWIRQRSANLHEITDHQKQIIQKMGRGPVTDLFEVDWQQVALCLSFLKDLVVISGGPGTGKTFTVLNIIAAHSQSMQNSELRIALAAPTGKAARRLMASIDVGKGNLPESVRSQFDIAGEAQTVHKLLGSDYQGRRFKYNEEKKLPYDLIVIDEASMLDITMWVRLIRALDADTKLIVLGDKDQLASVEAGSILGDICTGENSFSKSISGAIAEVTGFQIPVHSNLPDINDSVIFLTKSYRFGADSGIRRFAEAVNNSDADEALKLLRDENYPDLQWLESSADNMDQVIRDFAVKHYRQFSKSPGEKQLSVSNQKKILCALRKGPFGIEQINARAERLIRRDLGLLGEQEWYPARLVMSTRNDAILKLRNGELGICEEAEKPKIKFEGEETIPVSAARLKNYEPAYAITIHKSQGSEFEEVVLVLPNQVNSILSKEILYTGVTRARRDTLIISNESILRTAIVQSVQRYSGLNKKIWA